jgi:hypothetical protein
VWCCISRFRRAASTCPRTNSPKLRLDVEGHVAVGFEFHDDFVLLAAVVECHHVDVALVATARRLEREAVVVRARLVEDRSNLVFRRRHCLTLSG